MTNPTESTQTQQLEAAIQESLLEDVVPAEVPSVVRSVAECAYAAGILDGEGSVTISTRRSRSAGTAGRAHISMHVAVAQNDRRLLDWLTERWGGSVHGPIATPYGSLHHYGWTVTSRIAERFLRDVQPASVYPDHPATPSPSTSNSSCT
jgi:hypothetical protein